MNGDAATRARKTILVNGKFLAQGVTGVQRYAREITAALQRLPGNPYRIVVVAPAGPSISPPFDGEVVRDRSWLRGALWEQIRLPFLMRRYGAALLWSPCNTGPMTESRQVVTLHDAAVYDGPGWYTPLFRHYYRFLFHLLGRRVLRVLTDSRFSRSGLIRHGVVTRDRVEVVPAPVAASMGDAAAEPPRGARYILTVGTRDPRKNIRRLIEAWALVPAEVKAGTRLLIAGGRAKTFASDMIDRTPEDVRLLGYVPESTLAGLYRHAEAFVFPSLYEGFGLPPLEAMAAGTPALVSDIPVIREVCRDAALYFDPNDPADIAARITEVLTDDGLRDGLRRRGRERAAEFTPAAAAGQLLAVFRRLLDDPAPRVLSAPARPLVAAGSQVPCPTGYFGDAGGPGRLMPYGGKPSYTNLMSPATGLPGRTEEQASSVLARIQDLLLRRRAAGKDIPEPQNPGAAGTLEFEPSAPFPWKRAVPEARQLSLLPVVEQGRWAASELIAFDGLAFVTNAYRAIVARDPEPAGVHHLLSQLERGWPKAFLLVRLRLSAEGRVVGARVAGLAAEFLRAVAEAVRRYGIRALLRDAARDAAWLFRKAASRGAVPFLRWQTPEAPPASRATGRILIESTPEEARPERLLSICVTTYNRATWLSHSLPIILKQAQPYRDLVEIVVCDNASTDSTHEVAAELQEQGAFHYFRNEKNCGMLGNLSVCSQRARGRYVWVIGDDDLLIEGAIERVLAAIVRHPESELFYLNYACTDFDRPERLKDSESLIREAHPISVDFRDAAASEIREIATKSENCFTGIYCLIFRADHARRAYDQHAPEEPFSSLRSCVPTADYICRNLFRRPGYWVGDPCVVVNRNVSWMRYASLYSLERFPELFEVMQAHGAAAAEVDRLRSQHVPKVMHWLGQIYFGGQRANLPGFSIETLVRRYGHLPAFRRRWSGLRRLYGLAYALRQAGPAAPAPSSLQALLRLQ